MAEVRIAARSDGARGRAGRGLLAVVPRAEQAAALRTPPPTEAETKVPLGGVEPGRPFAVAATVGPGVGQVRHEVAAPLAARGAEVTAVARVAHRVAQIAPVLADQDQRSALMRSLPGMRWPTRGVVSRGPIDGTHSAGSFHEHVATASVFFCGRCRRRPLSRARAPGLPPCSPNLPARWSRTTRALAGAALGVGRRTNGRTLTGCRAPCAPTAPCPTLIAPLEVAAVGRATGRANGVASSRGHDATGALPSCPRTCPPIARCVKRGTRGRT